MRAGLVIVGIPHKNSFFFFSWEDMDEGGVGEGNGRVEDWARERCWVDWGPGFASQRETVVCAGTSLSLCVVVPCAGQHRGVGREAGDGETHSLSKYLSTWDRRGNR